MARVWDAYLTDRDKAHIALRDRAPTPLGQRPALLSIDNYRNVLGDKPEPLLEAVERWPASCGLEGWDAIEKTKSLLALFRERNWPVAHATQITEEATGFPNWNFFRSPGGWDAQRGQHGWKALRDRAAGLRARLEAMDPEQRERYERRYEIAEEVAPIDGEVIVGKNAPSAFWNTPLAAHLMTMQVDTLVVVGESTSGCVRASVVDAAAYRLPVVVVEDCVYDRHEAAHAINLFDMHRKYAEVWPLEQTLEYLRELPE